MINFGDQMMFELERYFLTDDENYEDNAKEVFQFYGEKAGQLVSVVRVENYPEYHGGPLKNGLIYHFQFPYGWKE